MATPFPDFSAARNITQSADNALLIFCRAPRRGEVKTRLARAKGESFALELYRAMLRDCFDLGRALSPTVATIACFTPADAFENNGELRELWEGARLPQRGDDLGARMLNAFGDARARGCARVVIIGSDAPDLPLDYLQRAFDLLRENENEVVVGPSVDGGFVLIGAARALPNAIFDGIAWSRADVCARLLANLRALKLSYATLESWHDVDEAADVEALHARLQLHNDGARATRAVLAR